MQTNNDILESQIIELRATVVQLEEELRNTKESLNAN